MADLLSTGIAGIKTYKRALTTVSNNITNVDTEGYHRQRVEIGQNAPSKQAGIYFGNGSRILGNQRMYDQFVESSLRSNTSQLEQQESIYKYSQRLENLMADERLSVTGKIGRFFAAVQEVSVAPASTSVRDILLTEAETTAAGFRLLGSQFSALEQETWGDMEDKVAQINGLSKQLASINTTLFKQAEIKNQPHDVLDQRDILLSSLSKLVNITVSEKPSGVFDVHIGNSETGDKLVAGKEAIDLGMQKDPKQPERVAFVLSPYGSAKPTNFVTSGSLAGLNGFRQHSLQLARDEVDVIAQVFVNEVNKIQHQGVDMNGQFGKDLLSLDNVYSVKPALNKGTATAVVSVTSASVAKQASYELTYLAQDKRWSITNEVSGQKAFGTHELTLDGLKVNIQGQAVSGDRFLITPSLRPTEAMKVMIDDLNLIATGSPLTVSKQVANSSSAEIKLSEFKVPSQSVPAKSIDSVLHNNPSEVSSTTIMASNKLAFVIPANTQDTELFFRSKYSGEPVELQIFTRNGRHLAGTSLTDSEKMALLNKNNGFSEQVSYVDSYLNQTGQAGYLDTGFSSLYSVTDVESYNFSTLEAGDTATLRFNARTTSIPQHGDSVKASQNTNDKEVYDLSTIAKDGSVTLSVGGIAASADYTEDAGVTINFVSSVSVNGDTLSATVNGTTYSTTLLDSATVTQTSNNTHAVSAEEVIKALGRQIVAGERGINASFANQSNALHLQGDVKDIVTISSTDGTATTTLKAKASLDFKALENDGDIVKVSVNSTAYQVELDSNATESELAANTHATTAEEAIKALGRQIVAAESDITGSSTHANQLTLQGATAAIATVTNVGTTIASTDSLGVIKKSVDGVESTLTALKINLEDQLSSVSIHGVDNITIDESKLILNGKDNKVDIDSGVSINIAQKTYQQTFSTDLDATLGLLKAKVDSDAHVTSSSISQGQLTLNGLVGGDDVNAQAFVYKKSTLQPTEASVSGDGSASPVEVDSEVFDFSGLTLGGSAKVTVNGTDYSQQFHTDLNSTLKALAQKININQVLNDAPTLTQVNASNGLLTLTGLSDGTNINAAVELTQRIELSETADSVTGKSSNTSLNKPDPRRFLGLSGGLNEDLLVFVTGSGGAKISAQWDQSPLIDQREAWRQDITVKFNSDGTQYELIDTQTDTSLAHVNYSAEKGINYNGWTAELTSDPAGDDVFYIKGNHDLSGDNRNILKMAALQNDDSIFGGRGNFGEVYTSTVGKLGTILVQTDIAREAQQTLVNQSTEARDSVSGVSLDEEAANLLRFQQAYQASAQVIKIANALFDSILSIR